MTQAPGSRMRLLGRLACLAVSLLALGWVFRRVDLESLRRTLAHARPGWILAAVAVFGASLMLAAARWHIVLRLNACSVHPAATARTVVVAHLFNTVLFGPTGGDLAKAAVYARWFGFATSGILGTCVLDRLLGGIGYSVFALCTPGLSVYGRHPWHRVASVFRPPRLAAALAASVALLTAVWLLRRRAQRWTSALKRIAHTSLARGADLLRNPRLGLRGVTLAVLGHVATSCVLLLCLKAVTHASFSMASVLWVFPVISLITAAPVTVAGAGVREGAALFFLGLYGIPGDDAVAASLLVLFTYLAWAIVAGIVLWRTDAGAGAKPPDARTISIVIPTLNEAVALPETVARALKVPEVSEIIVSDAGSQDGTAAIAHAHGCIVVTGAAGRGAQLRLGAEHARSDVILFLHADTWLPPNAGEALLRALRDRRVVGGGFWKVFREKSLLMAGSRLRCGLRLWLFGRIMGDQGMFVRRAVLAAIGGVPPVPLMEEFELCRRLRGQGRLALAGATVTTSARRFAKLGIVRTYLRMWHVTARYYLGSPPQKLREIYERD